MLLLCFSVLLLQLSFSACIDMTCNHNNLAVSSGNDLTDRLGIEGLYITSGCKRACQNSNKLIATCTAWQFSATGTGTSLTPGSNAGSIQIGKCALFNGNVQYKAWRGSPLADGRMLTVVNGPVYCPSERTANVRSATAEAGWARLVTCANSRGRKRDITCTYSKTVGISKSTGQSKSQETSAEFSMTYGSEVGDPLGTVKAKFEASASFGFSWTDQSTTSATFKQTTTNTASFPVPPGSVSSVCQPVGHLDDFVVHANHFKIVAGNNCD